MSQFTIGGKKVDNTDAQKALERLSNNKDYEKYFKDGNLTEVELGEILDIKEPDKNVIDLGDWIDHAYIKETGLTLDTFEALVREYQSRFPKGKMKLDNYLVQSIKTPATKITTPTQHQPEFNAQASTVDTSGWLKVGSSISIWHISGDGSNLLYGGENMLEQRPFDFFDNGSKVFSR